MVFSPPKEQKMKKLAIFITAVVAGASAEALDAKSMEAVALSVEPVVAKK
jgi:hypothetical protein